MSVKRQLVSMAVAATTCLCFAIPAFARPAVLTGKEAGSRINVRSQPSLSATSPHYGLTGDRVEVLDQTTDNAGSRWYYVQFSSGAKGWVRGDFVRLLGSSTTTGVLVGAQAGSRVNVRSAPSTQASTPHYGLVGDRVTVLRSQPQNDGYRWYYVRFTSGAEGWVRGDFIKIIQ